MASQSNLILSKGVATDDPLHQTFSFDNTPVRTVSRDGEIWFVASDVAKALEYRDAHNMARVLDDYEIGTHTVSTPSGDQEMLIISESGMYHAVLKSRKPEAKRFKRWVTAEVLPAIRKTGRYDRGSAISLTENEATTLSCLLRMIPAYRDATKKAEAVLRAAESPLAPMIHDAWHETVIPIHLLQGLVNRCDKVNRLSPN